MSLPVFLHSGMSGAPAVSQSNGAMNALLNACLVNGFNSQSVSSATASGGVVTFNFASDPRFGALDTVAISGASNAAVNGQWRVQSAASNQVLVAIAGVPDGAVGGTITLKFAPLGWTRPYSGTNVAAYRQGGSATHKRYLRVYDNTATADNLFYTRGYEAMTAINTGTGAFPTTAQVAGNGIGNNLSGVAPPGVSSWLIIGTPRFFFLSVSWGTDMSGSLSSFPAGSMLNSFFGELATVFKASDVYAYTLSAAMSGFNGGFYMPRSYAGTGSAISNALVYGPGGGSLICLGATAPDAGSGDIVFGGPVIAYDPNNLGSVRGTLPGVIGMLHAAVSGGHYPCGHQLTGVPGVTGRVLLINSYGGGSTSDTAFLMDEDWGDA